MASVPYLPLLLGGKLSDREKDILHHVERGHTDDAAAALVGCRARAVRHFRDRLCIPDVRQRALRRVMPFSVIQSFGFLGDTCFVTILLRRLPGTKLAGMAEESRVRQSFSPASQTTQILAEMEGLFIQAVKGTETGFSVLQSELEKSIRTHNEAKKYLPSPTPESHEDPLRERPVSVVLLAGERAAQLERHLASRHKTDLAVIQLNSIREIIAYLDCTIFSLYSSRLWLGLAGMVAVGKNDLKMEPPTLNCCLSAAEILRLIDGTISRACVGSSTAALQPPSLHVRQFARRDGFLFGGRRDRNPIFYSAKPWAQGRCNRDKPSVAYTLPYDIPESMEFYSAPEWLVETPNCVQPHERDGESFLIAREDGLLDAVARSVHSRSFRIAIEETLHGQSVLGVPVLAAWCESFLSRRARGSRLRSKAEIQLTAVYALMNFDADFLMRQFDQSGRKLVEKIESRWLDELGTLLGKFTLQLKGNARGVCGGALSNFLKVHNRPVRFMLVCARRRAERVCQEHVKRSDGMLSARFDALQTGTRPSAREERELIEKTLKEVGLYAALAVAETDLRNYFVNYASLFDRGERRHELGPGCEAGDAPERISLDELEDEEARISTPWRMWDPENPYDD